MKLNADLSKRAVVSSEEIAWVDSPAAGVQRRLLERDGEEVARATSIVRFAPGSHFPRHVHGGGEEFFVLEGFFSDESGNYGPGSYLRHPVGSEHAPYSREGGTIFVKLWQMSPEDQELVAIDTRKAPWFPGIAPGLQVMPLHTYKTERVALVKWSPGTHFQHHSHPGGEEILVLDGLLEDEFGSYPKGTWIRNPAGSSHAPFSQTGCLIYVKLGHLSLVQTMRGVS